jgi:hypothetical protein
LETGLRLETLTVLLNIFSTLVCQIAEGTEPQTDELIVEGIQFAKWGNMRHGLPKDFDISLEGTLSRNQFGNAVSGFRATNFNLV